MKYKRRVVGGFLLASAFSSLAADPAPEDVMIKKSNQHFISYVYDMKGGDHLLNSFEYTVQVNTDPSINNVYYFIEQSFINRSGGYDPATGETTPVKENAKGTFYSGIQPQDDGTVRFVFSSFVSGSVPKNKLCRGGADGGAGVSCMLSDIPFTPGGKYTIKIQKTAGNDEGTTYNATVTDQTTGITSTIGEWLVPGVDYAYISGKAAYGAVEKYKIPSGSDCSIIPLINVEYSNTLFNGKYVDYTMRKKVLRPPYKSNSSIACYGVPRATSAVMEKTSTGYIVKNSDPQ